MDKNRNNNITDMMISLSNQDIRLLELLTYSIGRICLKNNDNWEHNLSAIDTNHIVDWLKAAIINDADWLKNVDDQNRPKKLMKFSNFNSIIKEADKAMLLSIQRNKNTQLIEGDEELRQELDGGYYLVKLLTPAALDLEGSRMQHCIGDGAYDSISNDDKYFLSLRDHAGKPHITMEINDNTITQLQGKQNETPLLKYTKAPSPFLIASRFKINIPISRSGYIISAEGEVFNLDKLPDDLKINGDLDLEDTKITLLPNKLEVSGDLNLYKTNITLLPYSLKVGRDLDINGTGITSLPENLEVGVDLHLRDTDIKTLPENLKVGGTSILADQT